MPLWVHFKPKSDGKCQERENTKSIVLFCSYPKRNRKIQKNNKKIRKTKKYHYGFISSENRLEKDEKERKLKLSLRFVPARLVIENSKKIAKKFKKLKNTTMASYQAKIGWKMPGKRECKKYRSVLFLPDAK